MKEKHGISLFIQKTQKDLSVLHLNELIFTTNFIAGFNFTNFGSKTSKQNFFQKNH